MEKAHLPTQSLGPDNVSPLLGNPRRIRGLDSSMLRPVPAPPAPVMVGNPRRTRLPKDFAA